MEEEKQGIKAVKIGFLGDSTVGKTSVCKSFAGEEFSEDEMITIGSDKYENKFTLKNGKEIKVVVWDTAGQERFIPAALKIMQSVHAVVIIFSVTNKISFNHVENYINIIKENLDNPSIVIFGNMIDIKKEKWQITSEEVKEFAKKWI